MPNYNYNSSNELTSSSSGSYTYDANGNTLTDAQGRSFTWDFENRLTQVVNPGTGTTTFRYDPFGRRIQKSGPLGTTNYLYDGFKLISEMDNSGNLLARYTNGTIDTDEPLAQFRSATTSYYENEALGTVTSLSNTSGATTASYVYDAFGNLTASTGSVTNTLRYTAREFDTETGLYQNRFRYYDPSVGRFLSEDPIGFNGSLDFYSYSRNSPLNYSDPLGLLTTRDEINQHRAIDIDPECGTTSGGACTLIRAALVMCTCKEQCGEWKANAELRIYGDMWIYNGPFPYRGRRPVDRSVHDQASAIAHEYNVHINPAIAAVTPLIDALEQKTFSSEAECQGECNKTSDAVNSLFRRTLRETQQRENNQ